MKGLVLVFGILIHISHLSQHLNRASSVSINDTFIPTSRVSSTSLLKSGLLLHLIPTHNSLSVLSSLIYLRQDHLIFLPLHLLIFLVNLLHPPCISPYLRWSHHSFLHEILSKASPIYLLKVESTNILVFWVRSQILQKLLPCHICQIFIEVFFLNTVTLQRHA